MSERNYFDLSLRAAKQLPEKPGIDLIREKFREVEAICTDLANMPRENRNAIADLLANAHRVALNQKINNIKDWKHALEVVVTVYKTIREIAYDNRDMQLLVDLNSILNERMKQLKLEYAVNGVDNAELEINRNMNAGVWSVGELEKISIDTLKRSINAKASPKIGRAAKNK